MTPSEVLYELRMTSAILPNVMQLPSVRRTRSFWLLADLKMTYPTIPSARMRIPFPEEVWIGWYARNWAWIEYTTGSHTAEPQAR